MEGPGSPEAFIRNMPTITRFLLVSSFFITLAYTLQLFNPLLLLLDWNLIVYKLQFWRLFTDFFFFSKFSFSWVLMMYWLVNFSTQLERNESFTITPGAYLYFVVIQMLLLDTISFLFYLRNSELRALGPSLVCSIIYYWSRRESYTMISVFGFSIPGYQFPWAILFMSLIMGQSFLPMAIGYFTGHLYYFVKDIVPREYGKNYLMTPRFLDTYMIKLTNFDWSFSRWQTTTTASTSSTSRGVHTTSQAYSSGTSSGFREFGGAGRRLGTN